VTPDSEIYCEKVKMCRFSCQEIGFFRTKFVQLAVAGLKVQHSCGVKKIEYRQERTFHLFEMPRIIFFSLFLVIHTPWPLGEPALTLVP
jgi:hypothetical protein